MENPNRLPLQAEELQMSDILGVVGMTLVVLLVTVLGRRRKMSTFRSPAVPQFQPRVFFSTVGAMIVWTLMVSGGWLLAMLLLRKLGVSITGTAFDLSAVAVTALTVAPLEHLRTSDRSLAKHRAQMRIWTAMLFAGFSALWWAAHFLRDMPIVRIVALSAGILWWCSNGYVWMFTQIAEGVSQAAYRRSAPVGE